MSGATLTIPNTEVVTGRIDLQRNASTKYWLGHSGQDKGWKMLRPGKVVRFRSVGKVATLTGGTTYTITLYKNGTGTTVGATVITNAHGATFNANASLSNETFATDDQLFVECVLTAGNLSPITLMIEVEYF